MVVSLKPSKFYGSSLPRPRIYVSPDGSDRVDPPISVTAPLMSWAQEAHWSMGGVSFKRLRLMGKIEGNVKKLRSQREKEFKAHPISPSPKADLPRSKGSAASRSRSRSPSPPPAPIGLKRKRFVTLLEQENLVPVEKTRRGRRLVKKLGDDFDRVASPVNDRSAEVAVVSDPEPATPPMKRSRRLVKIGDAVKKVAEEKLMKKVVEVEEEKSPNSVTRVRVSPRLAKK